MKVEVSRKAAAAEKPTTAQNFRPTVFSMASKRNEAKISKLPLKRMGVYGSPPMKFGFMANPEILREIFHKLTI